MAYLNEAEIFDAYEAATEEATQWRKEYSEYERLADNGLLEDLDENLPEVNDGSLAASLFKLAKRVIRKKMKGRAVALDSDDAWLTELANIYWEKKILPNAKSKASPRRKWKDAARKAAIFGGQPIISLLVHRGNYRGADFIVPYVNDVKLEAGKDSDADSDIIFWDVYYTRLQILNFIEEAEEEMADLKEDKADWKARKAAHAKSMEENAAIREQDPTIEPLEDFDEEEPAAYNKWNIPLLKKIAATDPGDMRPGNEQPNAEQEKGVKKIGYHFFISFQRGVDAPFSMCFAGNGKPGSKGSIKKGCAREWTNDDPTGDVPVHYLYCYQDFVNPYGVGIVKLAGGTQNVLDYMRQADILATQVGIRPPKLIAGDEDDVDEESMVMAQDANWYVGSTQVTPWQMATGVYQQLPDRISMYQTSLQKFIPMGDSTISSTASGDPQVGRTPQALKMADASLSIDDEDFGENVDECYEAVTASMINITFASMHGTDIMKVSEDERDILEKAGWPFDEVDGEKPSEVEIVWDNARANFQFEVDAEADQTTDDETKLKGLSTVVDFLKDPTTQAFIATGQPIMLGTKKLDPGELVGEIIALSTQNDKILTDVTPEDQAATVGEVDPNTGLPIVPPAAGGVPGADAPVVATQTSEPAAAGVMPGQDAPVEGQQPVDAGQMPVDMGQTQPLPGQDPNALTPDEEEAGAKIDEVVNAYGVTPQIAASMLEAEDQGFEPEEILESLERNGLVPEGTLADLLAKREAVPAGAGANG